MFIRSSVPLLTSSAACFALSAWVASAAVTPKPIRVLYLDPSGAEQTKAGVLHKAMRELGRDAIYFDYYASVEALPKGFERLYDVAWVTGDAAAPAELVELQKGNRVLSAKAESAPEAVRAAVLGAVSAEAKASWEAFLAQRDPEKRESHPMVANYEKRPEPVTFQHPFNAKGAMERIQVPADMHLELFAEAPQIGKPIAMAWDARGRCWVASTSDYPHGVNPSGQGNDKITICEDTDGDGKADKFTVFAEGLNIPTGLCFVNGGILVAQPPHFLFLKDTNGDDKADVREVVLGSMWGIGDTHAQASNLHYGYDNWIYGAVGYSGFRGMVGGEMVNFSQGSYRLRPDGSKLEFLHQFSNNTWGQGYNEAGDQFGGTANGAPIFYGGIPASVIPKGMRGMSAKRINVVPEAHAITPNFRQVDVFNGYTAACGSSFVYSANLPQRMQGKALVCEPTMKLVALMDVRAQGAGYTALDGMNVFASSDEWTSPVYAEVGPDGAIWIADWQNFIIQHNPTPSVERGGFKGTTGPGGAHENDLRDHHRGRIYRVVWNEAVRKKVRPLEGASVSEVVEALDHDTQYWRLTAQRVLVEGGHKEVADTLRKKVVANDGRIGAVHALWTLHGLGLLDEATHRAALLAQDDRLRRNAIRALGTDEASRGLFFGSGVVADREPHTRLAAWVRMAEFPTTPEIQKLVRSLSSDATTKADEWLKEASLVLAKRHNAQTYTEGPNLLPNPGLESLGENGLPQGWMRRDYNAKSGPEAAVWESTDAKDAFHSGARALRVTAKDEVDTSFFADVELKPNTDYKLSAWVRGGKGFRGKVSLNDHMGRAETEKVAREGAWTAVETVFNSGDRRKGSINLLFVGKGEAMFDDAKLVELVPLAEEALLAGDPKRGEEIFYKHPAAACVLCHALKGQGSAVGPALDGIASRQNAAYIKQSLLEPNAVLAKGFEYLKVSPMPPMGLILKPQELEDIQAFLQTLK